MHIHDTGDFIDGCVSAANTVLMFAVGTYLSTRRDARSMLAGLFKWTAFLFLVVSIRTLVRSLGNDVHHGFGLIVVPASVLITFIGWGWSIRKWAETQKASRG